eukprot:COSAG02_NODE_356_length_23978_cov_7.868504_5_plen_73_part_00
MGDGAGGYGNDCKAPCQETIDKIYVECESCDDWETVGKAGIKALATELGCGGAAQAAPLMMALAAVANHFLN